MSTRHPPHIVQLTHPHTQTYPSMIYTETTVNGWAVRIILECILVANDFATEWVEYTLLRSVHTQRLCYGPLICLVRST